ncbi:hypothetical protein JCM3775_000472 [Rhodotorula graminis]
MHSGLSNILKERGLAQGDDPPVPTSHRLAPTSFSPPAGTLPSTSSPPSPSFAPTAAGNVAPSRSTAALSAPRPLDIPLAESPSSSSLASAPLDGPLLELMPALSVSASASSSEEGFCLSGRGAFPARPSPGPPAGRRVVSAPRAYLASPPRGSPLSRSVGPDGEDLSSWRRMPLRDETPFGSPASPGGPSSSGAFDPGRLAQRQRRRRSSASFSSLTSGALPSGSFVGSFEDCLLSGRMSAPQSAPLPFVASIGVLGGSEAPKRLKCPKHLHVPFGAVFWREPGGEATLSCPYVGAVNLDAHYHSVLVLPPPSIDVDAAHPVKLPRFPGYEVPRRGQIQLVLKNSLDTAFKPFLIPYDIDGLDRDGQGGRTFLRQLSYAVEPEDHGGKGKLRFAVHLQFCSPPAAPTRKGKTSSTHEPRFYLHRAVRVVFASRGLDLSDKLRVVHDGPGAVQQHARPDAGFERFADYDGPGAEWDLARRQAKARLAFASASEHVAALVAPPLLPYPLDSQSPPYPVPPASSSATIPTAAPPPLHLVAPSPFTPSSLVRSTSPAPLLASPAAPEPLTFDRVPSPHRPAVLGRKLSAQSGLSASRPTSRTGRSGSGERERIGR